jgi:predicted nucleic-acid-binding protein
VIGLDTNVLVRYLAQDDPAQSTAAARLMESFTSEAPGFLSTVALAETVWVLQRAYGVAKPAMLGVLEGLLRAREILVEDAETHYLALAVSEATSVDYADAVIGQAGKRAGCETTVTFDRRAATAGMRLLEA